MFALSRVGAPGCFVVELFAFYLLLGDWGLLNGGFLLMNLAILRRVSVCFISFFVRIVFVSLLKSILGKPKILCLDSSCAGQSFMRWSAVSSFFWRCEQSLQYIVEAVLSLLECLLSSLCPVSALVTVLREFLFRLMRYFCACSFFSVRLNIGAHSSLMLLFCQFALFSLSSFFMYLLIFSFCEVCGMSFLASCAMGRSDVAPAFASRSAISLPS